MPPPRPELQEIREVLVELGITSLLALPLSDGQDQMGVLLLAQSTARGWHSADVVVLKTISEQIVIALTNAGLRRLVKSLSVTDEQSGLLKRASYLDLLMAETRRAVQQSTPVTVTLMQFGKELGHVEGARRESRRSSDATDWPAFCRQHPPERSCLPLRERPRSRWFSAKPRRRKR